MNTKQDSPLEYSDFAGAVYRDPEANEILRKEWDTRHAGKLWTFEEEMEFRRIHKKYEGDFVKIGKCLGRTPRAVILRAADYLNLITQNQKEAALEELSQTSAPPTQPPTPTKTIPSEPNLTTSQVPPVSISNDLNKWTLDDEAYLVDAMRAGSSIADICARLKRSDDAIVDHLEAMGLGESPAQLAERVFGCKCESESAHTALSAPRALEPWSQEEDENLKELWDNGCPLKQITTKRGRTGCAVAVRLERLGCFVSRFEMSRKHIVDIPVEAVKTKQRGKKSARKGIGAKRKRDEAPLSPAHA